MRTWIALAIAAWSLGALAAAPAPQRPRVILITAPGGDPEHAQSLVRFLLYSDQFDVEAIDRVQLLVGSHGMAAARNRVHPELITERIEAYGQVRDNLLRHSPGYPAKEHLLSRVAAGSDGYGMEVVGDGRSTAASKLITRVLESPDPRPVYVVIHGGSNPLAQALWDYQKAHGEAATEAFVAKLRVYDSGGGDDAGAWMCHRFPNLFFVRSTTQSQCFMGPGGPTGIEPFDGPQVWGRNQYDWVEANVRKDHGPLGALYPQRVVGGRVSYMEGGGALWLALINPGLSDPEHPAWGGWGGRFSADQRFDITASWPRVYETEHKWRHWTMFEEAADTLRDGPIVASGACAALWRWRQAYHNDFQGRLDWCVKEFKQANHNPVAAFRGDLGDTVVRLPAKPGERVPLDASASKDPDGDALEFRWFVYPEAGTYPRAVAIKGEQESVAELAVPADAAGGQIHVIVEVKDRSPIVPMFRYRRVVIDVK